MENQKDLERAIVWILTQTVASKGMSQAEFARQALPGHKNPESTWSQIRTTSKTGEPRGLKFWEVAAFAEVLGEDVQQLIFRAKALLADGWTIEKAGAPTK